MEEIKFTKQEYKELINLRNELEIIKLKINSENTIYPKLSSKQKVIIYSIISVLLCVFGEILYKIPSPNQQKFIENIIKTIVS